jgi:hypothetical protein
MIGLSLRTRQIANCARLLQIVQYAIRYETEVAQEITSSVVGKGSNSVVKNSPAVTNLDPRRSSSSMNRLV